MLFCVSYIPSYHAKELSADQMRLMLDTLSVLLGAVITNLDVACISKVLNVIET